MRQRSVIFSFGLVFALLVSPTFAGEQFQRGNVNSDDTVDISDMVYILNFLFSNGADPFCEDAADLNDDGNLDISDPLFGLNFLFVFGSKRPPPPPGPLTPGFDGTPNDPFDCGDREESPVEPLVEIDGGLGGFDVAADGSVGVGVIPGKDMGVVVDPETGKQVGEFPTGDNPGPVRIGAAGTSAVVANYGSVANPATDVTWVDLRNPTKPVTRSLVIGSRLFDVAYATPKLALAMTQGTASKPSDLMGIIDSDQGENLRTLKMGFSPRSFDVSKDGTLAVVVGPGEPGSPNGGIGLVDLRENTLIGVAGIREAPLPLAVCMVGDSYCVSDGAQGTAGIVKLNQDLKPVGTVGRGQRAELLLSPDGKTAYSLTVAGNDLLIFDPNTMQEIVSYELAEGDSDPISLSDRPTSRMAFSGDGRLLLVASHHGTELVGVDVRTNKLLGQVSIDPKGTGFPVNKISTIDNTVILNNTAGLVGTINLTTIQWLELHVIDWIAPPIFFTEIAISGDTCLQDIAILMDDGSANANTSYVNSTNQELMENVVPAFASNFNDVYDFLVVFYGSEFGNVTSPGAFAWSWTDRNFTRGINFNLGNGINGTSAIITAAGTNRLQNFIWENDLNEYDTTARHGCVNRANNVFGVLRSGLGILGQEFCHRWGTRLDVSGLGCNMLRDAWHYSQWFNSDASVTGGNQGFRIRDDGGGNFTRLAVEEDLPLYDQYLMGAVDAGAVPNTFCVDDPVLVTNTTFTGTRRNITMNAIVMENGERFPKARESQNVFNVAYCLIVPNGDHVLTADLNEMKAFRDDFTEFVEDQTNGRVHLNTRICGTPFARVLTRINTGKETGRVAASPNGRWVYGTHLTNNQVSVIDADPESATFHQVIDTITVSARPTNVAFNGSSSLAYVTTQTNDRVDIINTSTRTVIDNVSTGDDPRAVFITPFGFGYAANLGGDTITLFNAAGGPFTLDADGQDPWGLAGTLDGELVVWTNRGSNTLTVRGGRTDGRVSVPTGQTPLGVDLVQCECLPNQTAARANGSPVPVSLAYVANNNSGTVTVVDITTNTDDAQFTASAIDTISVGTNPHSVAFQPNGAIALVTQRNTAGTVTVIEVATHSVIGSVSVGSNPVGVDFSPDGKRAYVALEGTSSNSIVVLEVIVVLE